MSRNTSGRKKKSGICWRSSAAFLRDVLASVTEGKLRLCYAAAELPAPLTPMGEPVPLSRAEGLPTLRHLADQAAVTAGFSEEQRCDLAISAGEAAMNAVVHAGTGTGTVSLSVIPGRSRSASKTTGRASPSRICPRPHWNAGSPRRERWVMA